MSLQLWHPPWGEEGGALLLSQSHPDTWVKSGRTTLKINWWIDSPLQPSSTPCSLPRVSCSPTTCSSSRSALCLSALNVAAGSWQRDAPFFPLILYFPRYLMSRPPPRSCADYLLLAKGLFVVVMVVVVMVVVMVVAWVASQSLPLLSLHPSLLPNRLRQSVAGATSSHTAEHGVTSWRKAAGSATNTPGCPPAWLDGWLCDWQAGWFAAGPPDWPVTELTHHFQRTVWAGGEREDGGSSGIETNVGF